MLDCDHATFLVTKRDYDKLGCVKSLQLRMHILTCKLCRAFAQQSKIINEEITAIKQNDTVHLHVHLDDQQKETLQETVDTNLKNK